MQVFDQLRFECLGVGEIDAANGNGRNLGDLRGAKSPCSGDDLETLLGERPHKQRRENPLAADAATGDL